MWTCPSFFLSLSFLSLALRISLIKSKVGIFPWLFWYFLCLFQGLCGFGSDRKSLVNLRLFLGKAEKSRNGRTGFLSFFVLFGTFLIFPGFSRFARGWSGDYPDWSFFSFSAY